MLINETKGPLSLYCSHPNKPLVKPLTEELSIMLESGKILLYPSHSPPYYSSPFLGHCKPEQSSEGI